VYADTHTPKVGRERETQTSNTKTEGDSTADFIGIKGIIKK
jgi:hypothetical protein